MSRARFFARKSLNNMSSSVVYVGGNGRDDRIVRGDDHEDEGFLCVSYYKNVPSCSPNTNTNGVYIYRPRTCGRSTYLSGSLCV